MNRDDRMRCSGYRLHSQGIRYSAFGAMFSIIAAREDDGTIVFQANASLIRNRLELDLPEE
jgi:hypothetical protein